MGDWRFLVDENLSPELAARLTDDGFIAEHVLDVLYEGAADHADVLPYCRANDAILLTNDYSDFNPATLTLEDHAGIVLVYDKERPAEEIAAEIRQIVEAYGARDELRGFENADDW